MRIISVLVAVAALTLAAASPAAADPIRDRIYPHDTGWPAPPPAELPRQL